MSQSYESNPAEVADSSIFDDIDLAPYERAMKNARIWLYVLAGAQFVLGIIEYYQNEGIVGQVAFGIDASIALVFLCLAFWSRKQPVIAFTTALVVYLLTIVVLAIIDPSTILSGILIKILFVVALVKAVKNARTYMRLKGIHE